MALVLYDKASFSTDDSIMTVPAPEEITLAT